MGCQISFQTLLQTSTTILSLHHILSKTMKIFVRDAKTVAQTYFLAPWLGRGSALQLLPELVEHLAPHLTTSHNLLLTRLQALRHKPPSDSRWSRQVPFPEARFTC